MATVCLKSDFFRSIFVTLLCVFLVVPKIAARRADSAEARKDDPAVKESTQPSMNGFHEDFKSLTVDSSTLMLRKPVVLETKEILDGKYTRERVQVGWRPADVFDLYIARPKDVKKPPVILYLYSFPENASRFQGEQWYQGVAKEGYAAVGFVSALTAERLEHRARDEWFVSLLPESLASSVHDVQMILTYLASRGDLDMDRVGMFGTGSGASIAILASAADSRIKAIDVFNPWGDWANWAVKSWVIPENERGNDLKWNKYIDPKFLEVAAPLDPVRWFPQVKARSVRLQYVQSEMTVPAESRTNVTQAAPERAEINCFRDYRVWMSVEHGTELFGWLRNELQADARSKVATKKTSGVHFYPEEGHSAQVPPAQPNQR